MKRHKIDKTREARDQTRLVAIEAVFSPAECSQSIADFTPLLKPAWIDTLDLDQSASIRKSSAVFVAPNKSTTWVFDRLSKAIREVNDAVYGFSTSANSGKAPRTRER